MDTILGIDGGGSKTAFLLVDSEGRELSRGETGPSNYQSVGRDRAVEAIRAGFGSLARTPDIIVAGFAGAGRPEGVSRFEGILRELAPNANIQVATDAHMAHYGALGGRVGVVVIAGTGSILIGKLPDGRMFRYGGWGYLFGDEGGGFWIGREAIRTALAFDEDQRGSDFPALVSNQLGLGHITEVGSAWADGAIDVGHVSSLTPLLVERLPAEPANGILRAAGQHLGRLVERGVRRIGLADAPVVLMGSVGELAVVRDGVGCPLSSADGTALDGAVAWARDRLRDGRPLELPRLG